MRYRIVFFQAEDGIRDLVRSRGLGDVYKRQRETEANQNVIIVKEEIKNLIDLGLTKRKAIFE